MVTAFVLIRVEERQLAQVAKGLLEFPDVAEVHVVAGEFDMVAVLRVDDNLRLSELITQHIIHAPGVERTKTLFALQSHLRLEHNKLSGVDA